MTVFGIVLCITFMCAWSIIGFCWVLLLDLFGKRNDYEKDYPLTGWQKFLAGPLVWMIEAAG